MLTFEVACYISHFSYETFVVRVYRAVLWFCIMEDEVWCIYLIGKFFTGRLPRDFRKSQQLEPRTRSTVSAPFPQVVQNEETNLKIAVGIAVLIRYFGENRRTFRKQIQRLESNTWPSYAQRCRGICKDISAFSFLWLEILPSFY